MPYRCEACKYNWTPPAGQVPPCPKCGGTRLAAIVPGKSSSPLGCLLPLLVLLGVGTLIYFGATFLLAKKQKQEQAAVEPPVEEPPPTRAPRTPRKPPADPPKPEEPPATRPTAKEPPSKPKPPEAKKPVATHQLVPNPEPVPLAADSATLESYLAAKAGKKQAVIDTLKSRDLLQLVDKPTPVVLQSRGPKVSYVFPVDRDSKKSLAVPTESLQPLP